MRADGQRLTRHVLGMRSFLASVLLFLFALPSAAGVGSGSAQSVSPGGCDREVQQYLTELPAVLSTERQAIKLLDAKHYRQAVWVLRSAVFRYDDPWAGYTLGQLYAAGLGVRRSATAAFQWTLWSARRGNHVAQRQLMDFYLNGTGVKRDTAQAAYWFRLGVEPYELLMGDDWLGVSSRTFANGTLGPVARFAPVNIRNERYYRDRGLRTLHALARELNGAADYELGYAYARGRGAPLDRAKALGYLCRAFALGDTRAAAVIREFDGPQQ